MDEERPDNEGWERRYRERHTPWNRGEPSPALIDWLTRRRLPAGRIVVPGCGYGHEVLLLAKRGYRVTAIDFAPSAIESLGARLEGAGLRAELVCEDWFSYAPKQPFDAVYEQTSLCALPPERWRAYVSTLASWLSPGGLVFALFMQTGKPHGPPWHCDPVAMQRLFMTPAWEWLEGPGDAVAHPSGFTELPAVLRHTGPAAS